MNIHEIINGCNEKLQLLGPASLTTSELIVVLVSQLACDVTLCQDDDSDWVFEHTNETVEALEAVGAVKTAAALARWLGVTGSESESRRCTLRRAVAVAFSKETPDVDSLLNVFIVSHANELKEHASSAEPGAAADDGGMQAFPDG